MEFQLRVFDPDGGLQQLAAADLRLQVVGFTDIATLTFSVDENGVSEMGVPYFDLEFGPVKFQNGGEGDNFDNALELTLTLTGKLATPPGAVVELRLFGATDGYEVLDQPLSVMVSDVPLTFTLETTTIPLLAGGEVEVPLLGFTDGSRAGAAATAEALLEGAPPHLVARFAGDSQSPRVVIRHLDPDNSEVATATLVLLDSRGGRAQVELQFTPVPPLPLIEAPAPLLVVAGQTQMAALRRVGFVVAPGTAVTWTAAVAGIPADIPEGVAVELTQIAGGNVDVAVTASLAAAGTEFSLELTANDGNQQQIVELPVAVVAAAARPRLYLSVKAGDAVVSSFILTDTLSVEAALEGAPLLDSFSVTLSIAKIDPSTGMAAGSPLRQESLLVVASGTLSIPLSVSRLTATLGLMASDLVELSIEAPGNVAGARLRLQVQVAAAGTALEELIDSVIDSDNDGLPDAVGGETAPAALGPIAAALARVTDMGARVVLETEGGVSPSLSLSLGNLARSVGLGDCGAVSLTLTLNGGDVSVVEPDECENLQTDHPSLTPLTEALADVEVSLADGDYQLLDLRATFDSSDTVGDELVLINLPAHPLPGWFYRVYRFVEGAFVPALDAGLPAAPAAPGILAGVNDCDTCLYAIDGDRDGSVELLLLLESVAAAFSSDHQTRVTVLPAAVGDQAPTLTIPLAELFGAELLNGINSPAVRVTQVTGSGNVIGTPAMSAGLPAVKLTGLRHTLGGAEEVRLQLLDGTTPVTGAVISLQLRVPNRPPVVTFLLPDGGETTSLKLSPNKETIVELRLEDPDGDAVFSLELAGAAGDSARLVSRVARTLVAGAPVEVVEHRLLLASDRPRAPFAVKLDVTDGTDGSASVSGALTVCFVGEDGLCPAVAPLPVVSTTPAAGGGGGGATGLLWLVAAAPALFLRRRLM